ncbi:MAG TPA: UbiA family prenyltransferase [Usitatibacter sp.]|nr:UbiA family prenyltransferase [Usitatibacter sp.]
MESQPPLVVDLDGTLIKTDMLLESLVAVLQRLPWLAFCLPFWLLRGRAGLKRELAARARWSPERIPYRAEVLDWVRAERRNGRRVVLATASDEQLARRIAEHLGGFDDVVASDGRDNLKGAAKRRALVERYGERGFDYVGNERADLEVWASARRAIVVGHGALVDAAARSALEARELRIASARPGLLWSALRAYQWPKNLLVFVPLITAHRVGNATAVAASMLAFAAFCLVASAIYVVNDLTDLEADRLHATKRERPFASGDLSIAWGLLLAPALLAASFAIALRLGPAFVSILAVYATVGLAYSLFLKRIAVLDIFVLAALYTFRIQGGAFAIDVPVSHWLFAFSIFLFLSLALAKRHGELKSLAGRCEVVPGRGYRPEDAGGVGTLGTVAGYLAVVVLSFYVTSVEVAALYRQPEVLWAVVVVFLFWITRLWLLSHRGTLGEDPLAFALRDPASYAVAGVSLAAVFLAT